MSLDETVAPLAPPSKGSATVRMDPHLLYASITRDYDGYVLSFDGSVKTEKHGGYGSRSWILWKLPAWDIVIAASAHLPSMTVIIAEYTGMNNGVMTAIEHGVTDLIIVGDSRLAIQQSMGVIAESRKTELKALNKIPEVLYVDEQALAETNPPAQRMQPIPHNETHAESQTVEEPQVTAVTRIQSRRKVRLVNESRPEGGQRKRGPREDPTTVQAERIRRLRVAQDEERRWADLKPYLKGDVESLSFKRAANASKLADRFVLDEDGLLQYVGKERKLDEVGEQEPQLRLVIPTTMIDEVLQSCHDSIEGGHQGITRTFYRVKKDYYWVGLYATVTRHVRACADCSTSKGKPHLKGYSPGNVLAERPFQLLYMDFVTPLPKTRRRNTSLMLFQCSFTGYVIANAMSSTKAQDVADVFEEYVFRRFGAPTMIWHDRDPRFMSETFKAFAELIQARSRATLSYRPQPNGQHEPSVKSLVQTVNVYVKDPLQQDWDDIAEKMAHAIDNSMDTREKRRLSISSMDGTHSQH
ncbi:unnamed protein product [Phytophthora fragariaefolia]|uniref:Unnamed protein product n=1 Tax=Phytophthora fragariaefolia TaxID=1490495 RepID=A0A9W6X0X0_9STRA|nr:unnamed protein product [Phytophthora fragariaefolia]